ncbi:MAG TPA: hypothetical protein DGP39_05575 [Verrucomicrobiales bacterium]|nr:hypothetical protein [Verrucomicrobiales bacterium]
MGKNAEFTLELASEVHDSSPVNDETNLYTDKFVVDRTEYELEIPTDSFECFTYKGTHASIVLRANLKVDDAWILRDSQVSRTTQFKLVDARSGSLGGDATEVIDPFDTVQFGKNFDALSSGKKMSFILMSLFCGLGLLGGSWLIWDIFSQEEDGVVVSVFLIIILLVATVCLWGWQKNSFFRSYINVSLRPIPDITRNTCLPISQLVSGKSKIDLKNMTLRVVACNMEMGQYIRGSGSNRRTVSFEEPVRPIILYSERVSHIPARQEIGNHFPGEVDFGPMFKALYPPLEISKTHGLAVYWEVQLLHDEFIDHELKGPTDSIEVTDFFIK